MAKVRYDVTNVESGNRLTPDPGVYKAKVRDINDRRGKDGKNDWEVIVNIIEHPKFKGAQLWSYISFNETADWKLAEFVRAIGLKDKGVLDSERLVGKELGIQVTHETWQDQTRARVNSFLPLAALDEDEPDEDEDEDEAEDEEEDEEEEAPPPKARKGKAKPAPVEDDEDDEEDEEDEDEDEDEDEEPTPRRKSKAPAKAPAKGRGKKAPVEEDEDEDEGEDEDEDEADEEAEEEDYTTYSLDELKEELESRGLGTKGTKQALIRRLEKDDANADSKPF